MSEDFCLETGLSPEEVESRLQSCWWLKKAWRSKRSQSADRDRTLRFWVAIGLVRNSWRPVWTCTLAEQKTGCRLEVRARCWRFVRIFMAVWFGMLAFFTAAALASALVEHNWTLLLACLGFWAFGLGLSGFAFWLPELEAKERLRDLLGGGT